MGENAVGSVARRRKREIAEVDPDYAFAGVLRMDAVGLIAAAKIGVVGVHPRSDGMCGVVQRIGVDGPALRVESMHVDGQLASARMTGVNARFPFFVSKNPGVADTDGEVSIRGPGERAGDLEGGNVHGREGASQPEGPVPFHEESRHTAPQHT